MHAIAPDPITVDVRGQGEGQPCQTSLTMPDGSTPARGSLDLSALQRRLQQLEQLWLSGRPEEYGQVLFEQLFAGALGYGYMQAIGEAGERSVRLRLALHEPPATLHTVPWERLYHPHHGRWVPLAAAPNVLLSRYLSRGAPWALPLPVGPLRTLVVISNPYPPGHRLHFDAQHERDAIWGVFGQFPDKIDPHLLEGPITLDRIARKLDEGDGFDILHYTGHGLWDRQEQESALILEEHGPEERGEAGLQPAEVKASDLLARLELVGRLPHLIMLAACHSAHQATAEGLVGLGPRLVGAGCPAVVCMQDRVDLEVARQFGEQFYGQLLEHGVVDFAVNRARATLHERWDWQWSVPVLFMRLADGQLFLPQERFRPARPAPYKFLASYGREDHELFKGRDELIGKICRNVDEHQVTVVYGEPGVGLTSLLEAGVRPLLQAANDLVVSVSEYDDLASEVRVQLQVEDRSLQLQVRGDAPLPDVLRAVAVGRYRCLVLLLDQFERSFDLDAEEQARVVASLTESLEALGPRLRLVLVVHDDHLGELAALQEQLADLAQPWVPVPLLNADAATEAIVRPLEHPEAGVFLDEEYARAEIVPDLDEQHEPREPAPAGEATIDPGQLQIVCYWLYEAARDRRPPTIDEALYVGQEGGAEGILSRYMRKTLETNLADEQELAVQVLLALASPDAKLRVTAEELATEDAPEERVEAVLERLVGAELLVRRYRLGLRTYAFPNQTMAREARKLGGEELERRYRAEDELQRIWRMWLAAAVDPDQPRLRRGQPLEAADRVLATVPQLRYLAEAGAHLEPNPAQALLLLRSAIVRHELDMQPWLKWLQTAKGAALISRLESADGAPANGDARQSAQAHARRLLGLHDAPADGGGSAYGPITRAALEHRDPPTRRTATLALTALQPHPDEVLGRLRAALAGARGTRFRRKTQAWATLVDADPLVQEKSGELSWTERVGVWWWRAWRRIVHHRRRIGRLTAGGGLGAGIALGLLRAIIAIPTSLPPGAIFGIFLFYGGILGAALSLGVLLSGYLQPGKMEERAGTAEQADGERPRWSWSTLWLCVPRLGWGVLLGTLFFGLAHFFVAFINGMKLLKASYILPMGLLAAVGLSASLVAQPEGKQRWWLWPLRLAASAAMGILALLPFNAVGVEWDRALAIGWAGSFYKADLGWLVKALWPRLVERFDVWQNILAMADAGLMGMVLTVGITVGLSLAARGMRRPAGSLTNRMVRKGA